MHCKHFGKCGSCTLYEYDYEQQINNKANQLLNLFNNFSVDNLEVFPSPSEHYRSRAEFRIWHEGESISYAMHPMEGKTPVPIEECPKVCMSIYELMEPLRIAVQKEAMLKERLFGVEFLAGSDTILVTLIYHKRLDASWDTYAKRLESDLDIAVIGRSRKVKRVISQDYITEHINIKDEMYTYKIYEGAFSQPSAYVNPQMISWALKSVDTPKDLLELYCGHGNFTLPLSRLFEKVLATEISKKSILAAKQSCELSRVTNISFLRMSVEELMSAIAGERLYNRLRDIELEDYDFSHVFVDPPRAGIDTKSLDFMKNFQNIIYISCNPETMQRDIAYLGDIFQIKDLALFDQFPHTSHMEAGAILQKT